MKPAPMPCEIEYVSGTMITVRNAGSAVSSRTTSMRPMSRHISSPVRIRAGAVATAGTAAAIGARTIDARNSSPTNTECRPVRAPSATPAADST